MKRLILSTLMMLLFSTALLLAQGSKVSDNLSMPSKILKMDRKYAIYLPPDYETSQRSYPVLYLLHGSGDDQTGWVQFGEVKNITDKAIAEGKCTAMIIVMPDGNTGQRGYFNSPKGDWNYEDFFFQEFIPTIEKTYRIRQEKRYRAIAGLSMGGGGSFMYALHHPELFSSSCPLSAYTGPLTIEDLARPWEKQLEGLSDDAKQKYFEQHSATELFKTMPVEQLKSVRWYIDCGEDDFLIEGNSLLHLTIHKRDIPHEFRMREGKHTWTYWREALPEVLDFVSQSFHQY